MTQEQIIIGTPVTYWEFIDDDGEKFEPLETVIRSDCWEIGGGEMVCKVEGKRGGVSINHLDIRQ